ncbi:hypothetical protein PHK61_20140 [Actinomycetospora lutea]|uniref:DUF6841 family protein n=1 Tax=Actinomycetospora lutea TaxID=663604 RepID=UPI002366AF58|nr:hypothetical protein [Actinomycetospora lutea]MDD7940738.1 hypothetical protein [Actinomycetospora lutea]
MDTLDVTAWFDAYLDLFVALGRGDRDDVEAILEFYGVPMLLSAPGASGWLHDTEQVIGVVRGQVEGLRHVGFDRTVVEDASTVLLNDSCARHEGRFLRLAADATVVADFRASYLIADGPAGPRIAALVVGG